MATLVGLELALRLVHCGHAPLLPYYYTGSTATLPSQMELTASFYGVGPNRYVTDEGGARAPQVGPRRCRAGIVVLGDSQALGYMLEFEDTFASRVAEAMTGARDQARIVAAPTNHPETLASAYHDYCPTADRHHRMGIVVVNLGNDLDEMYSEAASEAWLRAPTSPLRRWLIHHSFLFMDLVLIHDHWWIDDPRPLGINGIVYMLMPDERVVLARGVVREIDRILDDVLVADDTLVVIVPADVQLDPKQFDKYRRYYETEEQFDAWRPDIPAFAAMMSALETYIAEKLEREGHTVVVFSHLVGDEHSADEVFEQYGHHLTALGHQLLANAILERMRVEPATTPP